MDPLKIANIVSQYSTAYSKALDTRIGRRLHDLPRSCSTCIEKRGHISVVNALQDMVQETFMAS